MSRSLHYSCGHKNFIGYPQRWFNTINDIINELPVSTQCSKVLEVVNNVILEAEHLPTNIIGHILAIQLFSSYYAELGGFINFCKFPSTLQLLRLEKDDKSHRNEVNIHFLQLIHMSKYFDDCKYLQHIVFIIGALIGNEKLDSTLIEWRFGCSIESTVTVKLDICEKMIKENKFNCVLSIMYELLKSDISAVKQLVLWNISVILNLTMKKTECIELLELCESTFPRESNYNCKNVVLSSDFVTLTGIYQQLALVNATTRRLVHCRRYCKLLQDTLLKAYVPPELEHIMYMTRNDIAYLTNDAMMHQNNMDELQHYEVQDILDKNTIQNDLKNLASCCVLMTHAFKCLDNEDLQQGFEYYVLSYQLFQKNKNSYLTQYPQVEKRIIAQLYSLEGYFFVLKGEKDRAAVSYIKSFCEDERLVSSLFNHCLILIDLKKVAEAKASWKKTTAEFYGPENQYFKLSSYLANF